MATTPKISLKLLVDEKAKKVLFAEAGKDFVDFLFGLLKIPLGSIIGLLIEEGMNDSGSLVSVYTSVQNLDPSYLQPSQNKESLLKPKVASSSTTVTPPLLTNLLPLNEDPNYNIHQPKNKTNVPSKKKKNKKKTNVGSFINKDSYYDYDGDVSARATTIEVGYVKGVVTYMVMDDLKVKPMWAMSTISSITLLNTFNVKDVSKLQEKTVQVDNEKAFELMKALLDPNRDTVLTDIFIPK